MKEPKKILKKAVLITTLVAGAVGAGTFYVSRQITPNTSNNTQVSNPSSTYVSKLKAMKEVTNVTFDNETNLLNFDYEENPNGFEITAYNLRLSLSATFTTYKSKDIEVGHLPDAETDDLIRLEIKSYGDGKVTKNSQIVSYEYTLKNVTEKNYNLAYNYLASSTSKILLPMRAEVNSIDAVYFDAEKDVSFLYLTLKDKYKNDINVTVSSNYKGIVENGFNPEVVSSYNFYSLSKNFKYDKLKQNKVETTFTTGIPTMNDGMIKSDSNTIDSYINEGYKVDTIHQTATEVKELPDNQVFFNLTSIFKASKENEQSVYFEMSSDVTMDKINQYSNLDEYYNQFNSNGGHVVEGEVKMFDLNVMNQLEKCNEYYKQYTQDYLDSLNKIQIINEPQK